MSTGRPEGRPRVKSRAAASPGSLHRVSNPLAAIANTRYAAGMVTLPAELLAAPELALFEQQIRARLEDEQRRRLRFRDELSPEAKAEFINGEAMVHSPATAQHCIVRKHLLVLLDTHARVHRLGLVLDEKALVALTRNDYEPDIAFFGPEKATTIQPRKTAFPPPDFIAEVLSDTTAHRDRGVKFRDYAAHGVAEYWLVDPETGVIEQHENADGRYQLLRKPDTGTLRSRVVPGFEIPVRALFDPEENLAALRQILAAR
jgi:Uma2 family endonuclease